MNIHASQSDHIPVTEAEEVAQPTQIVEPRNAVVEAQPAQPPAVVDQQAAVLNMIGSLAADPSVPIERLQALLDMKERIDDRAKEDRAAEARAAYFRAMAECQAELKVVVRNKDNGQTKSKYADLAALARQADPIIHKHGFMVSFAPAGRADNGDERIRWTVAHRAGHVEDGEAQLAVDDKGPNGAVNKTRLHGFGSTMSYGRRYLKLMLFDIATGDDDDGNKAGSSTITEEQFLGLRELLVRAKADEAKFLVTFKVKHLEELPAERFEAAKGMLWQKIATVKSKGADNAS